MNEPIEKWDLFISHASDDKEAFVEPLAAALRAFGVRSGSTSTRSSWETA
jgi:hypothetical protein